jgi:hypothetical protein
MTSLNFTEQKTMEQDDIIQPTEEPAKLNSNSYTSESNASPILLVLYAAISMGIVFLLFR